MANKVDDRLGSQVGAINSATATPGMALNTAHQARLLFQPLRLEIMRLLAEPRSCGELAAVLGGTAQRMHYHVKALEQAGLVKRVGERKVRALTEGIYQASAQHFWPTAALLHSLGPAAGAQDSLSRSYLLGLAEELGSDAARLALGSAAEQQSTPTLSLSASVNLPGLHQRNAFLKELQHVLRLLAEKYGTADEQPGAEQYKLILACYPTEGSGEKNNKEDTCD